MTITEEDIHFLEANQHHYDVWVKAQYVKHLDGATRTRMLALIRKYFAPGYMADLWCQQCVAQMLVYLYTQYNAYKQAQQNTNRLVIANDIDLIGDFIGTIPVTLSLADAQPVELLIKQHIQGLAALIPQHPNLRITVNSNNIVAHKAFNLSAAFIYAQSRGLHMIQSHYHTFGLPVPAVITRPALHVIPQQVAEYDYVLAPFSRSLPAEQKWQREKWQQLVNRMPGKTFCVFGTAKYDDVQFITGSNVTPVFDEDFTTVCNTLQRSRHGVISVVTGISHLAYALGVKNYLFFNQGAWGKNPEAILLEKPITNITVDEVLEVIKR